MVDKSATLREPVTVWEGCKELSFACSTYPFFTFSAISLSSAFAAAAASEKLFIWLCPLVPTFPQLICNSFPCCSTAQNLCDFSS
ncbi:Uncharacterised protein [Shigella sonnei]|nr:Uncharacterised protein [Shigella sonnei]CST10391.1 Uncharacterised protein [Shigella sonnei]